MILERVLSVLLLIVLFMAAGTAIEALPAGAREKGAVVTLSVALLLTVTVRTAVLKPLFLISMLVRFHTLIEGQPINQQWSRYLDGLSPDFSKGKRA